MKHTLGPWEACEPGDYGDFDGESRVVCGDDKRIAVVHWHPHINTAESDANARLIAAAPELLEALEELMIEVKDMTRRSGWFGCGARGKAISAIAKARGDMEYD